MRRDLMAYFAGIEQLRFLCKKTHQDQNCPSDQ